MHSSVGLTGARGVLGRRIAEAFARLGVTSSEFAWDVRDRDRVDEWVRTGGFSTVIHCAALVPVEKVRADPGSAVSVNIAGTANLGAACAEAGKRLVYISTAHVYAPSPSPLSEGAEVAPVTLYGLSKLHGEDWCRTFSPETLVLRVFSFFDARQSTEFMVPNLCRRISTADPHARLAVHGLANRRDLASAAWLATAITTLALSNATGIVNCGTGSGWTIGQVFEVLKVATGRQDVTAVAAADQDPATALIADTSRLRQLSPELPSFDLTQSLTQYAHDRLQ